MSAKWMKPTDGLSYKCQISPCIIGKQRDRRSVAARILLLFGGIFCHFLFWAVKEGIQITFLHGIYINNYWDLENIFHKWDATNTCCKKTTSLKHRKQQSSKHGYILKIFTWFSWILSTNPFKSAPLWNICSTESSSKEHNI